MYNHTLCTYPYHAIYLHYINLTILIKVSCLVLSWQWFCLLGDIWQNSLQKCLKIFFTTQLEGGTLLTSTGYWPRALWSMLQCTGQPQTRHLTWRATVVFANRLVPHPADSRSSKIVLQQIDRRDTVNPLVLC